MTGLDLENRLIACRAAREKMQRGYLSEVEKTLGEEAALELGKLLSLYDERLYIWLAGLWQPEIGGFYHSESGRGAENMLPDIESTGQVLYFLVRSGLTAGKPRNDPDAFPKSFRDKISEFTLSLLDPEDGYFYHPQWGKRIPPSRRGRDLGWAMEIIEDFGLTTPCPTAIERLSGNKEEARTVLPEHLTDIGRFKEYLDSLDINGRSYYTGNLLQSQTKQIVAAGEEFSEMLLSWIREHQREDNGLWQPEVNYDSVNGLMKIGLLHTTCQAPIPRPDKALDSTIKVALSDEPTTFVCQFFNPVITIGNLLDSFVSLGREVEEKQLRAKIREMAPELIRKTAEKIALYKVPETGAFAYSLNRKTNGVSQGMHVGVPGLCNGNVNATCICSTGTLRGLYRALGIEPIPFYCKEDSELFFELIRGATVHQKTEPYPGDEVYYQGKSWFYG